MELHIKPSSATPIGVTASNPTPETKAPASSAAPVAAVASPSTNPSGSASTPATTAGGTPPAAEKPGRAAAAAKRAERQAAAKAAEAEQKTTEAKSVTEQAAKYEAAIKSGDPDKILAAFGMDDEKLVDLYIAKHGSKDPGEGASKAEKDKAVEELKAELEKFKQELADEKVKTEEKRKAEEANAAVRQHVESIRSLAAKPEHAERFELVNAEGAHELAFDVMVEVHKQHGKFISYEEALDLTENHLVSQEKARLERLSKLKKLGGAAPAKAEEKKTEAAVSTTQPGSIEAMRDAFKRSRPRVTNSLSVSTPGAAARPQGRAAADQRFREKLLSLQRGSAN